MDPSTSRYNFHSCPQDLHLLHTKQVKVSKFRQVKVCMDCACPGAHTKTKISNSIMIHSCGLKSMIRRKKSNYHLMLNLFVIKTCMIFPLFHGPLFFTVLFFFSCSTSSSSSSSSSSLAIDSDGSVDECVLEGVSWDVQVQAKADSPHCKSKIGRFRDRANRNTKFASFTLYTLLAAENTSAPAGQWHCRTAARYSQ